MNAPGQAIAPSGVLGGGTLKADDYASFLATEYLADYLPSGGAAVKVAVVGDGGAADRLDSALAAAVAQRRGLYVSLSAELTRVHMVDQIYFAVSRAVDWEGLAADRVRAAYREAAFPVPDGVGLTIAEVARHHDVDVRELYRSVRRLLERGLLGNPALAAEMGRAILRLAQAQLGSGDVDVAEHDAVLGWLRGELRSVVALRSALIYARIGRHNAREMITSTAALLLAAGHGGLVVHLDYGRIAEGRRPPADVRSGFYYSKAAALDAYEVLRQFIDATDELRGVLVIAVVPPQLMTDEARGLPAYTALQLRVADEVRDRRRANPYRRASPARGPAGGRVMTVTIPEQLVARRRAVEALRSGVPSWDAVAVLGSGQPAARTSSPRCLSGCASPAGTRRGRPACCSAAASAPGRVTCSLISAIWPWRQDMS